MTSGVTGIAAAAAALAPLLLEPLTVVDAGARWGVVPEWEWFGDASRVVGFEPEPVEAARLAERYAMDPRVTIVDQALGGSRQTARLHITPDASGSSLFTPLSSPVDVVEVVVTPLDEWCEETGTKRVDAMKLDVQGAELDILRGATHALGAMRALKAEVHFNVMYNEAPLFGEVDSFLRRHGFVLWNLPVTARYVQGHPGEGLPTVEVAWFDDRPVPVAGESGQLIWADALYVKEDLIVRAGQTDGSDPWERVRDACIALGFEACELARLALHSALPRLDDDATLAVQTALEALRSNGPVENYRRSRERALREGARVLEQPLEVDLGPSLEGAGWHDPQPGGDGWVRWTERREAFVDLPVVLPAGTTLEVRLSGATNGDLLRSLALEVDGLESTVELELDGDLLVARTTTLADTRHGFTRLFVRTGPPVSWRDVDPGCDDTSDYGVAVCGMLLRPPDTQGERGPIRR